MPERPVRSAATTSPADRPGNDRPRQQAVRSAMARVLFLSALVVTAVGIALWTERVSWASTGAWNANQRLLAGKPQGTDLKRSPDLLPVSLRQMLEDGRAEDALSTLEKVSDNTRAQVAVFEVAALLEAGDVQQAETLWHALPPSTEPSPFRDRVGRGLTAIQSGVQAALFDRNGAPVAYRTVNGQAKLSPDVSPRLLPSSALTVLPEVGGARLTLDLGLSEDLLNAINRRIQRRVQGGVVVLDANDASILAAVSTNSTKGALAHDFLFTTREPASIAKLLTTTAALRAGLDPDSEIRRKRCNGGVQLDGQPLYCSSIGGRLRGLDQAMATSCNVAFALLGQRVGASALLEEYRLFGFADSQFRAQPLYGHLVETQPNARELGDIAIGLNLIEITPLHAAVMARTLIDGYLRTPEVLVARDGLLGLSPRPDEVDQQNRSLLGQIPAPERYRGLDEPLLPAAWLPTLHSAMAAVADPGGSAFGVEPNHFGVSMKTGTASEVSTGFHINYIGFAPQDNPQFAFALRLTHARTSKRVRRQAKAVTREILKVLSRYQSRPVFSPSQFTGLETIEVLATQGSESTADVAAGAG